MEITALFDDVDMAETALVNLQSLGVFALGYKIRMLRNEERDGGGVVVPAADGLTNSSLTAATPGMAPANVGLTGFALADLRAGEPPKREVILHLSVDDEAVYRAQSALISNHGRRVRIVS